MIKQRAQRVNQSKYGGTLRRARKLKKKKHDLANDRVSLGGRAGRVVHTEALLAGKKN